MTDTTLLWFRQDLRLTDNPALDAALRRGKPIIAVYVFDPETEGAHAIGGAARWWLHHSLAALSDALGRRGSRLILRRGRAATVIPRLAEETGAGAILWNRCYEPFAIARDTALKAHLKTSGRAVESFNAALLVEPWTIANKTGGSFKVFTPFWKACRATYAPPPALAAPDRLPAPATWPDGEDLDAWGLRPTRPDWAAGFPALWRPGEAGADALLRRFIAAALDRYRDERDRPDRDGTSRLSPHLHFGEIGPAQIWRAVTAVAGDGPSTDKLLAELGWREFAHHLLFHAPDLPERNLRREFDAFPWRSADETLAAWRAGQTGYPIVDAGMRALWRTGWMHNRVRMITASFLVKHLMLPWQLGAAWFWDTLVDADLANNSASWQWVAGSGADAAPYFRIFNPILQGERFDPDGAYVRAHVPELADMPAALIHKPWLAPERAPRYPAPIIDHETARARALDAFAGLSKAA